MEKQLFEAFFYDDLSDNDKDTLYKNFSDTYIDSTGASFSRDDFDWRADNWEFYGDINGGVTVRRQRSGLLKLTSSYESIDPTTGKHNTIGVLKGLESLMLDNPDTPIWGAMPPDMSKLLTMVSKRKCPTNEFSPVPAPLVIALGPKLMKAVGSSDALDVIKNPLDKNFGCIIMDTPAGPMAKKLVANRAYYDWLKESAKDKSNDMIQGAIAKLGGIGKFLKMLPGFKGKTDDEDEVDLEDQTDTPAITDDTTDNTSNTTDVPATDAKPSIVSKFLNKFKKD